MKCRDIALLLATRRELTPAQELVVRSHLATCTACTARWRADERAMRAMQALPQPAPQMVARVVVRAQARQMPTSNKGHHVGWQVLVPCVALGLMLLIVLLERREIGAGLLQTVGHSRPPAMNLYISEPNSGGNRNKLLQINSSTLTDVSNQFPSDDACADQQNTCWRTVSADGMTIATTINEALTITIADARTGKERISFHPPQTPWLPVLSADGTRLVVHRQPVSWPTERMETYIFDTQNGRLISTITSPGYDNSWLNPTGQRLYALVVSQASVDSGAAHPPFLVAYDTASGRQAGYLELNTVAAGFVRTNRFDTNSSVRQYIPGSALSPDGQHFAILHADREALTMVDTEHMQIEWTKPLAHKMGFWERLLAPKVAHVKELEGQEWQITFSADGQQLYAFGTEGRRDQNNKFAEHHLGLRVIDVQRAEVIADLLPDTWILQVLAAPDNTAVYIFGPQQTVGTIDANFPSVVRRIDTQTLKVTAERNFSGWRELFWLLAPPSQNMPR